MQKKLITVAKLLILAAIVIWLVSRFERSDWEALRDQKKNWPILVVAFGFVLGGYIVSFLRWMILVRALGVPFAASEALRLGFLGHLFSLVSAGSVGGDLFKAIAVARRREQKRPEVIASVLMDRAIGLVGLLLLVFLGLQFIAIRPLGATFVLIQQAAMICLAIGLPALFLIVLAGHRLPLKWLSPIPFLGHSLYRMAHSGLIFYGRPGLVLALIGLSLGLQTSFVVGTYLISASLYDIPPTMSEHFQAIPPAFAAGAIPLTPGGMGVVEIAVKKLFSEIPSVPEAYSGLVVAIVFRMMALLVAAIGAVYYLLGFGDLKPTLDSVLTTDSDPVPAVLDTPTKD